VPKGIAVRVRSRAFPVSKPADGKGTVLPRWALVTVLGAISGLEMRRLSSVVEHPIRNRAVPGSNPGVGLNCVQWCAYPRNRDPRQEKRKL
jgi:hypothetical protein